MMIDRERVYRFLIHVERCERGRSSAACSRTYTRRRTCTRRRNCSRTRGTCLMRSEKKAETGSAPCRDGSAEGGRVSGNARDCPSRATNGAERAPNVVPRAARTPTRTRTGRGDRGFAAALAAGTAEKVTEHRRRVPASLTDALRSGRLRSAQRITTQTLAMTGSRFLREKSAVVSVSVVVTHQRAASVSRATRALAIGWRDARSR
jgi:hypothetical protein